MPSDPPIDSPCRITLGKVLRPVRRVSTALMKSPSSASPRPFSISTLLLPRGMTSRTAQVNLDDFGLWEEIVLGQDVLCHLRISRKHVNNTTSRGTRSIQGRHHLRAIRLSIQNNNKKQIYLGFIKDFFKTGTYLTEHD